MIELNEVIARMKRDSVLEALNRVEDATYRRIQQLHHILTTTEAQNILSAANGERYRRIYNLHNQLYSKLDLLWLVMTDISSEMADAHERYNQEIA